MDAQKDLLDKVMEKVVLQVVDGLKDTIAQTVEKELSSNLSRALVESEFYRRISDEMRGGLQNIYKQIADATRPSGAPAAGSAAPAACRRIRRHGLCRCRLWRRSTGVDRLQLAHCSIGGLSGRRRNGRCRCGRP